MENNSSLERLKETIINSEIKVFDFLIKKEYYKPVYGRNIIISINLKKMDVTRFKSMGVDIFTEYLPNHIIQYIKSNIEKKIFDLIIDNKLDKYDNIFELIYKLKQNHYDNCIVDEDTFNKIFNEGILHGIFRNDINIIEFCGIKFHFNKEHEIYGNLGFNDIEININENLINILYDMNTNLLKFNFNYQLNF